MKIIHRNDAVHTPGTRDAALRRLARANRWLIAGSAALTGILTDVAANAFSGHTVSTGKRAHPHREHKPLSPPRQAPKPATTQQEAPPPAAATQPAETPAPSEATPAPAEEAPAPVEETPRPEAHEASPPPPEEHPEAVVSGGS